MAFDINNFPVVKLALPLVAGIIVGWLCDMMPQHTAVLFVCSAFALVAGLFSFSPKWLFGVGATGVMLAIGLFTVACDKKEQSPAWSEEKLPCTAQLLETPYMGGVTTRALAYAVVDDTARVGGVRNEGCIYICFANSVEAEALRVGEKVRFDAKIKNPTNNGNPAEFDVARYMRIKGVSGSVYLPISGWQSEGMGDGDLFLSALALRSRVLDMYERLGFSGDEMSLLSAFSVGERRGFPEHLKEVYSSAGVSHLLALSGLHLGVFYMLVVAMLSLLGVGQRFFVVGELSALLLMWAFAFVAGLTPSVMRAALLFTFVGVVRCLHRETSTLNSLALAAVVMLVFSPRLLFDIGFQLSFSAVIAILLLSPWLCELLQRGRHGRVYDFFAGTVAVTISAQIGVLPFVWYYFGSFPLYFLFANILLVPLATILMLLVVFLWLSAPIALLQSGVAFILSLLLSFMNGIAGFFASLPGASLLLPQIGVAGACFVAFLLVLFLWGLANGKYLSVALSVLSGVAVVLMNIFLFTGHRDENYILLFNNRKSVAVLAVGVEQNYLLSSIPRFDAECDHVVEPYILRERLAEPLWVETDCSDSLFSRKDGLIGFAGLRLQVLCDDCWQELNLQQPVDALILCRGFLGKIDSLLAVYPTGCVILDGSLYAGSRRRIKRECVAAGVGVVDISVVGAVKLKSNGENFTLEIMRGK